MAVKGKLDTRYIWIFLGIITLLLKRLSSAFPEATELIYARGLFSGIRYLFDYTVSLLPIPLFYFLLIGLVYWVVSRSIKFIKNKQGLAWPKRLGSAFLTVSAAASIILFLFFVFWAYNYSRVPVEKQLGLSPQKLSKEELVAVIRSEMATAVATRQLIPGADSTPLHQSNFDFNHQNTIRPLLTKVLQEHGFSTPGRVRVMTLYPKGLLMRFGTSGVYLPFIGQGQVDGGLHPVDRPYTLAHEMAHGYGFGDEGTCNFWAYLACLESENPAIRYAGHFNYLEYLLISLKRNDRQLFDLVKKELPLAIQNDLLDKKRNNDLYPDWVSAAPFNDAYLKAQGVKEGILSYSRVVLLVEAWRRLDGGKS